MGYVYCDDEMLMAAQIAYLDIGYEADLGKVVDQYLQYGECDSNGEWHLRPEYADAKNSSYLQRQMGTAANIKRLAENNPSMGDSWRNWKIVDFCDDNDNSGYYGCVIDTGNGNCIITNRGSEGHDKQVIKDWAKADFGLLDSTLTEQQAKAQQYIERIYYKYGGKYDSFSVTGHSLGGNLAEHMTIHAPVKMRSKIDHCISYDGPGFSQDYIDANRELIDKTSALMDRYQWSFVSSLLLPLPGVNDRVILAHDGEGEWGVFGRHDIINVELDENGSVQSGEKSGLSDYTGSLSQYIEHMGEMSFAELASFLKMFFDTADGNYVYFSMYLAVAVGIKLISAAFSTFNEICRGVQEFFTDFYYNVIAPNVSGSYEVDINGLCVLKEELIGAYRRLNDVCGELSRLQSRWPYNSGTGAYYRSRLCWEKNGLESDIRRLECMAQAAERIACLYSSADEKVETLFY